MGVRNTAYAKYFADSIGLLEAVPELEFATPQAERARSEAGALLDAHVRREFNIPGVTFGERYDSSPIVFSDASRIPPDTANEYIPSTNPGGRLPHVWLGPDESLYDRLNSEWTVLAGSPAAQQQAQAIADCGKLAGLDVGVVVLEVRSKVYALDDVLVVRPDQVIAWHGRAGEPVDPIALWEKVAQITRSSPCET